MKPIKLTIKGINSFIEAQEIDFAKLTKQGLFGIFGATGSGKSTILDGITLALYGEVARKSANYINTNCDTAYVSYEFQISGQVAKRYRVDREFKRDKKTDSIRTKSAKIVEISGDNDIVLEDMVKSVTAKCEEIIGLKLDDFTRTVVLPQGKFSEFLKLTGSERSKMLERLFNLQKYGDDLSSKLIRKIRAERNNASRLEGELNGYEGCNAISLKEKNKEFAKMQTQFTQCKIENDIASENYKSGEILWNLQIELKKEKDKETRKKEDDEQIAVMQKKVVLGESALKVKPYIDPYEETQENLKKTEKEIQELADKMSVIAVDRKKIETTFEAAQSRKEKDLSKLKIEEHQVKEAIVEKVKLDELLKETSDVSENISRLKTKIKAAVTAIEINEKNSKIINGEISTREAKIEELRVSEDYKSRINNGVLILSDYKSLTKQTDDLVKIIDTKKAIIAKEKTEKDKKFNEFTQKTEEENRVATLLNQLVEHCPGDQDAVLKLRDRLSEVKIKWDKDSECNTSLQKAKAVIELLTKKISDKTLECDLLINEITKIAENIQKVEREHVAYSLRVAMVQGDICPVCGSREHSIESVEIPEMDNLETLKAQLQEKTERNQKASAEILTAQSSLEQQNQLILENKQKLLELGEDYKSVTVETLNVEFEALKSGLEKYNKDKADLENKIKIVTQEKNKLEIDYKEIDTLIKEQENQIKDYTENLTKIKKKVEKAQNKLAKLKEDLGIEDIETESTKLSRMEEEKSILETEIKKLREKLQLAQQEKEEHSKELGNCNVSLSGLENTLAEKEKVVEEKRKSIKEKAGEINNLDKRKLDISTEIKDIEDGYSLAEKNKNEITKKYEDCNIKIINAQNIRNNLSDRFLNDKEKLERSLAEENLKDRKEAKDHLIPKGEIEKLKKVITEHKEALNKIAGTIERLEKMVGDKALTQEEWSNIITTKEEKADLVEGLKKSMIQLEENIKKLSERMVIKTKLLKEQEKLNYTLALLSDLEKLFKGKKFVDFVAVNQLKYVSIEACKKLKEITGGNYGLEVDEDGKFLIRDYKNGGAQRDATTLSGGETFLASLSLALALSAQIQLKGTAPLELFFLDEGFGTLDENLLETVMDSLEKVHNESLSIGIISHLEAIKSRMPVKLVVTPAMAGMGGSKVKIERD